MIFSLSLSSVFSRMQIIQSLLRSYLVKPMGAAGVCEWAARFPKPTEGEDAGRDRRLPWGSALSARNSAQGYIVR